MEDAIIILSDDEANDRRSKENSPQPSDDIDIAAILQKYGIPKSPKSQTTNQNNYNDISSDTEPYSPVTHSKFRENSPELIDNISDILKKYEVRKSPGIVKPRNKYYNDVSDSDNEPQSPKPSNIISDILRKYGLHKSPENSTNYNNDINNSDNEQEVLQQETSPEQTVENKKPRRKRKSTDKEEQETKKLRKEQEKITKREERERARAEVIAKKAEKQAMATAYKNIKPEECIKYITAIIDTNLVTSDLGTEIQTILNSAEVNYKVSSQLLPNTIIWTRQTTPQLIPLEGQLGLSKENNECSELIYIIMWDELVKHVHEKTLCEYFVERQSILSTKKMSVGIYGLVEYFRFYKNIKNRNGNKISAKEQVYTNAPKVKRKQIDMALSEVQILTGCSHRMLDNSAELANMILNFTKSIAQVPYKLGKQARQDQMDWYVAGCNKDSVKVDKSGNGLASLWRQQLTQFSLARLETADAVSSVYSTPTALMVAYDRCSSQKEAEQLLKDVPIRRAAGPLSNVRKLGPELSKKICAVFTSHDGETVV